MYRATVWPPQWAIDKGEENKAHTRLCETLEEAEEFLEGGQRGSIIVVGAETDDEMFVQGW